MRAKKLKINNQDKIGILLCGDKDYKVYSVDNSFYIKLNKGLFEISDNYMKVVSSFVNIKYYPSEVQNIIERDFNTMIKRIQSA